MIILLLSIILLVGCVRPPQGPQISRAEMMSKIPEEWANEPIIILSDSVSEVLEVGDKSNRLTHKEVQWIYVQKRNPNLFESIQFYESNSVQERSRVRVSVYYPDGDMQKLKMRRYESSVQDQGDYLSTNQFYWHGEIPKYQKGIFIRTEISRPYFKPEHLTRIRLRNAYPTVESVIELNLPQDHKIQWKFQNPEKFKVQMDTTQSENSISYELTSYQVDAFRGRAIYYPEDSESAIVYSLPPQGIESFDWVNLGNHYLNQLKQAPYQGLVAQWAKQLNGKPVAEVFDQVRSKIRYLADEYGIHAFIPRDANEIITKGYGDCKETSNLFKSLLDKMGIESQLVLVSTSGELQLKKEFPSLGGFNHMIIRVNDPERGEVYYDPTIKDGDPKESHFHLTHQKVFILEEGNSKVSQIKESANFNNQVNTHNTLILDDQNQWKITGTISLKGYSALYFNKYYKQSLKSNSSEAYLKHYLLEQFELKADSILVNVSNDKPTSIYYEASFQHAWIPLDQGGLKLDAPSIYGGKGRYTSQESLGNSTMRTFTQEDTWEIEDEFKELDTHPVSTPFAQGDWILSEGQVQRNFKTQYQIIDTDQYRTYRKQQKKFNQGKIWK